MSCRFWLFIFVLQALYHVTVVFLYIIVGDLFWCCLFVEFLCFYWWFIYSSFYIVGTIEENCVLLLWRSRNFPNEEALIDGLV